MEEVILEVFAEDIVAVWEPFIATGDLSRTKLSTYFQPQFVFTIDKDKNWAPVRSRAPSVTIDFGIFEADA